MCPTLTPAFEDYLKAIYDLTRDEERASTLAIAGRMEVTPASVTGMIQRLAACDPPLLDYQKHQGVALTPAGLRAALDVIRRHRLLETYLQERLGYAWDEVHSEADRLEHVLSDALEERIARALGDPSYDPHGEPIPSRELDMPPLSDTRLSDLRPGQQAVVERIASPNPELLRHLAGLGLIPGERLSVVGYSALDGNLHLQIGAQPAPVVLGPRITERVFVIME